MVDCDVVERGGKQYVDVKDVHADVKDIGHYSMKFQSPNVIPFVTAAVNRIINANWRLLFKTLGKQLQKNARELFLALFEPIFKLVPIQDFYQNTLISKQTSPKK